MPSAQLSRRAFTGALVAASLTSAAAAFGATAPPKEGGLSSEGLLAGHPGFQPRSVAPLPYAELPGFLSAAQLTAHHAAYRSAVEELENTEQELSRFARSNAKLAEYGALRGRQVALANDVLLHEFYFGNLAAKPDPITPYVRRHINEHMGSADSWAADFTMCALSAQAWAALVYDPYDDRWHNTVMDSDNDGVWIGANPLVVCDVSSHAYTVDYQERAQYIARFIEHIDWSAVGERYRRVDRM
jgi:superoxide dismutase, Fe-Mn family